MNFIPQLSGEPSIASHGLGKIPDNIRFHGEIALSRAARESERAIRRFLYGGDNSPCCFRE